MRLHAALQRGDAVFAVLDDWFVRVRSGTYEITCADDIVPFVHGVRSIDVKLPPPDAVKVTLELATADERTLTASIEHWHDLVYVPDEP
jgi:hypothetical protein